MRAPGEDLGLHVWAARRQARLGAAAVKLGAARTVRDLGCSVGDWSCSEGSSEAAPEMHLTCTSKMHLVSPHARRVVVAPRSLSSTVV